jgi:hypothetical protein
MIAHCTHRGWHLAVLAALTLSSIPLMEDVKAQNTTPVIYSLTHGQLWSMSPQGTNVTNLFPNADAFAFAGGSAPDPSISND